MSSRAGAKVQHPKSDPTQQRQAERHELEVEVDFESDTNFYTGLTQNISTGGLFIATHNMKRVGDYLHLKFKLPSSQKAIECDTEVRWIRENSALHKIEGASGMGVRFVNLSAEDAGAIEAFITHRDTLYYDDE